MLRQAGFDVDTLDLSVDRFDEGRVRGRRLVVLSTPMHTALRLGMEVAARVRALEPAAHVCFAGPYAALFAERLLGGLADSVVAGEVEGPLVGLAAALRDGREVAGVPGVSLPGRPADPHLVRTELPRPDRRGLPPLSRYAGYVAPGRPAVAAGYVEASRGCKHLCRHCPLVPVYRGRFFAVPVATVLADVAQQVEAGARHVTFGDPDFLNGPTHALRVARAVNAAHPDVTFDFTAKVEHLLAHASLLPELRDLGCTFVVSAVESTSDLVLRRLRKGHTAADVDRLLALLDGAGIALHPTLVAFTPWTSLDDYLAQLDFFRSRGLAAHLPAVQLSIRLLVPPRSALLEEDDTRAWIGAYDEGALGYAWRHPDPRMDALHAAVAARVEEGEARKEPNVETWEAVRALAHAEAGRPLTDHPMPESHRPEPPRLTAHWFC